MGWAGFGDGERGKKGWMDGTSERTGETAGGERGRMWAMIDRRTNLHARNQGGGSAVLSMVAREQKQQCNRSGVRDCASRASEHETKLRNAGQYDQVIRANH